MLANIIFLISTQFVYSNVGKIRISNEANVNRITSYNDLLKSDSIVESAISNSNLSVDRSVVKNNLSLSASNGSRIYTITLKYKNKEDGKKLCESIISVFVNRLPSYDGSSASIYDGVITSNYSINLNIIKNELTYIVAGCVLAFAYVFVIFYFDKKIKSDVEIDNHNILGKIINSTNSDYNNKLNLIKTKIKLSNLGNVLFMNTPKDINCKSDVLALVKEFSKDSKILFIDTNIRNKSKKVGYSDLLKDYKDDISKYVDNKEFDMMESGTNNNDVEVLLSSKNNEKLINNLKKKYDYIILYNSNVVDYSDSLILSKICDCNYIIVGINQTDRKDLEKSINVFNQVNTEVNGIIIIDKEPEIKIFKKFSI